MDFREYSELYHYGIMGMHWGIRRYQPYPKDYTGDGREIGEAARVQKKLVNQAQRGAKGFVMGDSNKAYSQYLEKDPDFHKGVEKFSTKKQKASEYLNFVAEKAEQYKTDKKIQKEGSRLLKEYLDSAKDYDDHMEKAVKKWLGNASDLQYKEKGKEITSLSKSIMKSLDKEMKMHYMKYAIDNDMKINPGSILSWYYMTPTSVPGTNLLRYYDRINNYDAIVRNKNGKPVYV